MKSFFYCLALLFILSEGFSQKAPAKFGDISIADLEMKTYAKDTSAVALVLVDFGESSLQYNEQKGFHLVFERHRRIKILKKGGLDYAEFGIQTYHKTGGEEKLSNLKGVSYNLVNGKIVATKMKTESIFKEKVDKNYDLTKFTIPNVQEGSVIEFTYRITSDFLFNFQGWQFQSSIPIVWSEYRASFPEYFHYDKYSQGYIPFSENDFKKVPSSITLHYKEREGNRTTQFHSERLDFLEHRYRWVAKDVPAFKPEPYITTPRDYISRISFELAYTQFPQQQMKRYMGTWADINKFYYDHAEFGGEIRGNNFLKRTIDEVTAGMTKPEDKIAAIHNYVKSNITWDGVSTDFTRSVLKKVVDERKGNSAEINLLLISMLEKAGFNVNAVLTSTRDHGFIREQIPVSTQFNYVLCLINLGDKQLLLDATEPLLPIHTLPERCLNGKGFMIDKENGRWINIVPSVRSKTVATLTLKLLPDGRLTGDMAFDYSGYPAFERRKKMAKLGQEDYLKEFKGPRDWDIENSEFQNLENLDQSFQEKFAIEMSNQVSRAGDVFYINPFLVLHKADNPFKIDKREYPVDFGYPHDEVYMVQIEIPDGYEVDELPQSKVLMLPQGTSRYLYNISQLENKLTLTSSFSVNKSLFSQLEYPDLREFFNQVVAKQAEQIVLKKKL